MIDTPLERALANLKLSSRRLSVLPTHEKNEILKTLANRLIDSEDAILEANRIDLQNLDRENRQNVTAAFRDRLTLNPGRLAQMADSVRAVAMLPDPVGETVESRTLENGLKVRRVRAPLGSILVIFESRPNVITEVFALAFKSGNAVALRGGSDSKETARVIYDLIDQVLADHFGMDHLDSKAPSNGSPNHSASPFVGIRDYDRGLVGRLLLRDDAFDICIPRGGSALIERVSNESRMPVIKNDKGVCHLFIHESANLSMATEISINAKTQRPGVCNAIETILIDRPIAKAAISKIVPELFKHGVEFYACDESHRLVREIAKTDSVESPWAVSVHAAKDEDFFKEYLDLKVNLKVVDGLELAIFHIEKYGSHHSEAIVTEDENVARRFQGEVDSACVYWNASTRFTDGFALGLGGEIGISTQKLHVRGPVGLRELTSVRWVIDGTGQIRR